MNIINTWAPEELQDILQYKDGKLILKCKFSGCAVSRQTAGKSSILRKIDKFGKESLYYCREHGGKWIKFTPEVIDSWPENHKQCASCLVVKRLEDFHKHSGALFGYNTICKQCRLPISKFNYKNQTFEYTMYQSAKSRATKLGREFTISLEDIVIPEKCPVFNVEFIYRRKSQYVPSIDRIDSSLGYTPDNIQIISWRANWLKSNMSPEELDCLHDYMVIKNKKNYVTI